MNKQKKLHHRSSSTAHFQSSLLVETLRGKLEDSELKIKMLEGYISSLVSKIQQKDRIIKSLHLQKQELARKEGKQQLKNVEREKEDVSTPLNVLGESVQDITNVDQNELNIKNRMESMKTFQINKMHTLFQRNMRENRSIDKIQRVVSHNRILQLKPGNIRLRQPQSPLGLISINDQPLTREHSHMDSSPRLFENFLVVSGDISQLDTALVLNPKILYSYPQKVSIDKEKTIPLFCFPNGIECVQVQVEERDSMQESSVFILNSQFTTANKSNRVINQVNPNHYLYGICLRTYSNVKREGRCYKIPVIYVMISYFPFINLFNQVMTLAIKSNKPLNNVLINQKHIRDNLKQLHQIKVRCFPAVLKCNIFNSSQTISFPEPHHIDNLVLSYCNNCVSKLSHHILADLLLYFLLEYSIVLYSSCRTFKSQVITLLLQIVKPLKYPFPIITQLPPEMEPMLDSPFPCILGVSAPLTSLSDSHVYIDLDSKQLSIRTEIKQLHYVFDYTRESIKTKGTDNEVVKRLKYLVREEILCVSDKKSIMTPFLEKFKGTQIYKYNHQ